MHLGRGNPGGLSVAERGAIRAVFAGRLTDEEILAIFHAAAEECRHELKAMEEVPQAAAAITSTEGQPRDAWCWFLTLECGLRLTRARLAWIEDVIARIGRGELPKLEAQP